MTAEIPVIVNAKSGPDGEGENSGHIEAAFRTHGLQATVIVLQRGQDIASLVRRFIAEGVSLVVAGGGDGTINAVAAELLDSNTTLGVLPLGTLNHFARDLGIPFELDDAVRIIADGHCIALDAGEANGATFLNNSSMGLYPRIVSDREHARKYLGLGKWPALVRATMHALRDPGSFNAVVCVDGEELERRTPFIFVGNNRYVLEGFGIGKRTRLDAGVLSLYVLRPKNGFGLLWLGIRSLFGIGSHARDFDAFEAVDFHVEAQGKRIEVATDGEVMNMESPVRYRIRPKALRVMAPRGGNVAAGKST
jgi:YegS/Rv2252/BmrU family lipid kinase